MDNRAVWAARASQDDPRVFRRQDRRAPRRPPDPASNSAALRGKASKRLLVCSTGTGGANARQRPATGLEATAVVSQEEFEVPALTQGVAGPLSSRQFLSPPASTPRLLRLGTPPAPSPSAAAKGPSEGGEGREGAQPIQGGHGPAMPQEPSRWNGDDAPQRHHRINWLARMEVAWCSPRLWATGRGEKRSPCVGFVIRPGMCGAIGVLLLCFAVESPVLCHPLAVCHGFGIDLPIRSARALKGHGLLCLCHGLAIGLLSVRNALATGVPSVAFGWPWVCQRVFGSGAGWL